MNKKKEIFPPLRFRGYKSKWIIDGFDFEFLQTNSFSRAEMDEKKGSVKNIHYGDILTRYNDILRDISVVPFINKNINLSKFREESYLKNGDIVIADTAEDFTAGKAVEVLNVDFPVLAGQHTFLCRPKINFAPGFIGYYLNSPAYHNILIPLLTGTKVYSISKANIKNTFILYPENYEEQQKIADCLSSIDGLIDAESRKLKALEKYKKGLMQKLFPAEGKTLPEWRFPECKNTYEIKRKRLADVCYYKSSALTTNDVKMDGKYNLYDANKIIGKVNIYASEDRYITIIKDGAGVGRVRLMDGYTNFVGTMGMINNNEFVTIDYLYYLLQTIDFRVYAIGGTIPHIYFKDYSKKEIFLPHIGEQQKITDCLSEIDTIITEQSNKVEQLKIHKKGLMQGLFPSLEEADV
ncbi:TPA: restriction endonuclease subunit S [Campylobacter coli]|nr:restriction endonuclease subunit S [Campylobacter coli]